MNAQNLPAVAEEAGHTAAVVGIDLGVGRPDNLEVAHTQVAPHMAAVLEEEARNHQHLAEDMANAQVGRTDWVRLGVDRPSWFVWESFEKVP